MKISLIILMALLVVFSLSDVSVYANPILYNDQSTKNSTTNYPGGNNLGIVLTPGYFESLTNFSYAASATDVTGITTNMSSWSKGCCLFLVSSDKLLILVYNTTGSNLVNISIPSVITDPTDIWTNASDTPVTDFWVTDGDNARINHLTAAGGYSSQNIGNFSTSASSGAVSGLTSNISSGQPTVFFTTDYTANKTMLWSAAGVNSANWSIPAGYGRPRSLAMNETGKIPALFIIGSQDSGRLTMGNTTISALEVYLAADFGATYFSGITVPKGSTAWNETWAVDLASDKVYRLVFRHLDTAVLSTNETGSWSNISWYSSPYSLSKSRVAVTVNFTWNNNQSVCNRNIGWRVYFNDTLGNENVTGIGSFIVRPYVNGTSYAIGNISSSSCESQYNITLTMANTPAGYFELLTALTPNTANFTCAYGVTGINRFIVYNTTTYCYLKVNHSALSSGSTLKVYYNTGLSGVKPSNLPTALAGIALVSVTMIYLIVKKSKRISWS